MSDRFFFSLAALPLVATVLATTAPAALAQGCLPEDPGLGGAVVCLGADADGFEGDDDLLTVDVDDAASVRSSDSDAIRLRGNNVTVRNDGQISADEVFVSGVSGDEGIQGEDFLTVINGAAGVIEGGKTGIAAESDLEVTNVGQIRSANEAIEAGDDASILNLGFIEGDDKGIQGDEALRVTNEFGASIFAGDKAVDAGDFLELDNRGSITSAFEGVEAGDFATVFNEGTITAGEDGVQVGEEAEIENVGTIVGATGDGIDIDSGLIDNLGLIEAEAPDGAGIDFDRSDFEDGISFIFNEGVIRGGTGILVETGEFGEPANVSSQFVFNDGGTIEGTSGIAANLGAGDDLFAMAFASTVIGDVLLGDGDDLLLLGGGDNVFAPETLFDGGDGFDVAGFGGWSVDQVSISGFDQSVLTLSFAGPPAFDFLDSLFLASAFAAAETFSMRLTNFEAFLFEEDAFALNETGTAFVALAPVPLPAAAWMLLSAFGGLWGVKRLRTRRA